MMLEMHRGLLTLVQELDAICRKHNITYYLEGGSLLGAVRHRGFLPWDDDVDLCITRDNFQKLLSVIDQELPANRELYCYERFPGYLRDTVKYTNLDSTVLFYNHILDGNAAGQHIDLFILDPVPSDAEAQAEYKKWATIYSELLTPVYVLCNDIVQYLDEYNECLRLMEEKGREYVLQQLREKLFTMEDSDECDTYLLRWGNRHSFYPKAYFGEPVELEFEGCKFLAPRQYYRFLRAEFGDNWMIIPDAAHQEDHGTFDKFHVPCKTFIDDYSQFIDYKKFWKDNERRKQANLEALGPKLQMQRDEAELKRVLHEMNLQHLTMMLPEMARKMMRTGKFADLADYFMSYYSAQLTGPMLDNGLAIRVEEPVLYAAALALVMTGELNRAEKLIRVNNGGTGPVRKLSQLILDVRACMLAVEEERFDDANVLAAKWIDRFPYQLNLAAFLLKQDIQNFVFVPAEPEEADALQTDAENGTDMPETEMDAADAQTEPEDGGLSELTARIEKLLGCYPENDQLLKLKGDLLAKQGLEEEALACYRESKEISRNGLLLMELAQLIPEPESEDEDESESTTI